ncbi:MAG TPA: beta-ketoacyl-[acyl-carrier-protein] synthase family protein [Nitrospirota bacterium]
MNRVVITGIGTVNALAHDAAGFWEAIKAGRTAIRPIENFDTSKVRSKLGAEVRGFDPSNIIDPMKLRRMDKLSQMVLVSSIEAMRDAGINSGDIPAERMGIVIGNGFGGSSCTDEFFIGLIERGPAGANPMLFPTTVPNSAASITSIELGIKGPNSTFCQKDVSAEEAMVYAIGLLRKGAADAIISGGGEELNFVTFHAFGSLNVLSERHGSWPEGCFPFDRKRNGRVLGEGAGVLVFETLESAKRRGARIYAEVAGEAMTGGISSAHCYGTETGPKVRAMRMALERSGLSPEEIGYISASANSTHELDPSEAAAVKDLFGPSAGTVPISTIRPMTGDFEGMGGLRLLTSVLTMRDGCIPPTLGLEHPLTVGLAYVRGANVQAEVDAVLHNGFGNGGACACIVLKKHSNP